MPKEIIYNAHILTMDAQMNSYPQGSVLIENGKIKQISAEKISLDKSSSDKSISKVHIPEVHSSEEIVYTDAMGKILMPGFINTHCHIPMTILKGFADDLPLQKWLMEYVFPAEAKYITAENVQIASRLGILEMIKSGTTCFNDMYFFEDVIGEEAKRAGIRAVLGEAIMDFPTPSFKTVDEGIAISMNLHEKWGGDSIIHTAFAPHSVYTCSAETLKRTRACADKYGSLVHIHLSETKKEVEDCMAQHGVSPVNYLRELGVLDSKTLAAHCVWLSDNDVHFMNETQTSICHCPKSNLKLASGIARTYDYAKAGVNVSIATDGSASNNKLDMVEELRIASLLAKGTSMNPEAMNARNTLRSATVNGALAIGLDKVVGSIEIGKDADLILIDADNSSMVPVYDEYSAIVYAMNSSDITSSMVHGDWIMKDRKVLHIDEADTFDRIKYIADKIKNNL